MNLSQMRGHLVVRYSLLMRYKNDQFSGTKHEEKWIVRLSKNWWSTIRIELKWEIIESKLKNLISSVIEFLFFEENFFWIKFVKLIAFFVKDWKLKISKKFHIKFDLSFRIQNLLQKRGFMKIVAIQLFLLSIFMRVVHQLVSF